MSEAKSRNQTESALFVGWDQALDDWRQQRAAGELGNVTEFVAGLPTEIRPLVRQELEQAAVPAAAPGRPRFERLRELGQGSFGRVDLAFDHHLRRQVAIKAARPGCDWNAARQLEEARRLASLRHESIVPIYDIVAADDGGWQIVSAYVEGQPLSARMARGALPVEEAVAIAHGLCAALQHAHERGVIHRDVKPSNVLLDSHGHPHLLDFGLAILEGAGRLSPCIAGTPGYRPPEFERDAGLADPRSDVYSLGIVLHEMLTGHREIGSGRSRLSRSSPLIEVCRKATAADPQHRFASAAALAEALRTAAPSAETARRPMTRRGMLRGTAPVIAVLVALAVTGGLLSRTTGPDEHAPVRLTIACSERSADIGFSPLDATGRPQFEHVHWTRPGEPLSLAPGDYHVTAIAGGQFIEVFRHVRRPSEKPRAGKHLGWVDGPNGVELPPIKLVAPRFSNLKRCPGPHGQELHVMPTLVTLGDYVEVFEWVPPPFRKGNPPPQTPLTGLSYDESVAFAEASGMRLPEPEELDRVLKVVTFPQEPASLWTTRLSGTQDLNGRQLLRVWTIPRSPAALTDPNRLQHQINRSAHPVATGMLFVWNAEPPVRRE